MRILRCDREAPSNQSSWTLHHLTDVHMDDRGHAKQQLAERIAEIRDDPFALWTNGGDAANYIYPGDKRYRPGMLPPEYALREGRPLDYCIEQQVELWKPIMDKCVGFGIGNHESTMQRIWMRNPAIEVLVHLGRPDLYLGYKGWSQVVFTRGTNSRLPLGIYFHHGWSGGRLKGRKALQGERDLGHVDANVILTGHDHQPDGRLWYTDRLVGSRAGLKVRHEPRAIINGGSWVGDEREADGDPDVIEVSDDRTQSWSSEKDFRYEGVGGPILGINVDFATGTNRTAGFEFELRWRS
jgi:hypothetical protein